MESRSEVLIIVIELRRVQTAWAGMLTGFPVEWGSTPVIRPLFSAKAICHREAAPPSVGFRKVNRTAGRVAHMRTGARLDRDTMSLAEASSKAVRLTHLAWLVR